MIDLYTDFIRYTAYWVLCHPVSINRWLFGYINVNFEPNLTSCDLLFALCTLIPWIKALGVCTEPILIICTLMPSAVDWPHPPRNTEKTIGRYQNYKGSIWDNIGTEILSAYWPLVRGIHQWPVNSHHKESEIRSFDVSYDVNMNKFWSFRWLETL